jgi:hypothetical protein
MSHAFTGAEWDHPCVIRESAGLYSQFADFQRWCERARPYLEGAPRYVPGIVMHLWHGTVANRKYMERRQLLFENDFDPALDIGPTENGTWKWTTNKPRLHQALQQYFADRREDGEAQTPAAPVQDAQDRADIGPVEGFENIRAAHESLYLSEATLVERLGHTEAENSRLRRIVVELALQNETHKVNLAKRVSIATLQPNGVSSGTLSR